MRLEEFQEGKTFIIDKPLRWTSFDVVNKLRWHIKEKLGVKKIKVGHAGTLDPLATGLLILCSGKHTKLIETIQGGLKTYTGTILLGKTTPSYDLEKEFDKEYPIDHITEEMMEDVRASFEGVQDQLPPIFSAKQVNGRRAYDLARAGKEVELQPNEIEVQYMTIETSRFPEIDFEIQSSKGTYIRSIAHDFGQKLNSGGTLIALRRTASGEFSIQNSTTVEQFIEDLEKL
ncbi:MAG: tRNA pseudouridine55 synthase [Lentimonas sp.]|jgi:tRNA pseudouridine55 synthase